jgi:hypothetical protein
LRDLDLPRERPIVVGHGGVTIEAMLGADVKVRYFRRVRIEKPFGITFAPSIKRGALE